MRTTVSIDDHLLARAKERAQQQGVSLGDVVDESLQLLFTQPPRRSRPELPMFSSGGVLPGIDYTSNASMFEAADDLDELARRAGLRP